MSLSVFKIYYQFNVIYYHFKAVFPVFLLVQLETCANTTSCEMGQIQRCFKRLHLWSTKCRCQPLRTRIGKFCHTQTCSSEDKTTVMCVYDKRRRHGGGRIQHWTPAARTLTHAHMQISITSIPQPGSVPLSHSALNQLVKKLKRQRTVAGNRRVTDTVRKQMKMEEKESKGHNIRHSGCCSLIGESGSKQAKTVSCYSIHCCVFSL